MAGSQRDKAAIDENRVPTLIGVSSSTTTVNGISFVLGSTPVPVAVNPSTGGVLVEAI